LGTNFQEIRWDCPVVRFGRKGCVQAKEDACTWSVDGTTFPFSPSGAVHLFDISRCFVENFPGKARGHISIWAADKDPNKVVWEGKTVPEWEAQVAVWRRDGFPEIHTRSTSPYMESLPPSMRRWVGRSRYVALPEYL
jgi:hypothetical protein